MSDSQNTKDNQWQTSAGFLFACIGAAVGLGNIWKFPSMAGEQGGGAFVLIYLASIFAIAIPIAAAELAVGRQGQSDATNSVKSVSLAAGYSPRTAALFGWVGTLGLLGAFVLLSFYAVIAGWVSHYLFLSLDGTLANVNATSAAGNFNRLLADPITMVAHQFLFLAIIGLIVIRKLAQGLERANLVMIPALILMLLLIAAYGIVAGDAPAALKFLFTPDISKINAEVVQSAVGHGFFSVGVGAAILITYGAYIGKRVNIGRAAITIGLADTAIALLAGIAVFSIVFAQGLSPTQGPGLIFQTLPLAFAQMPGGNILAVIFFLLVYFAALTSGLSLAEAVIRRTQNALNLSRRRATALALTAMFVLGLASAFSFNIWSDITISGRNIFDTKDYLTTSVFLPLGGLLIVSFAGWALPRNLAQEIFGGGGILFSAWLWAARVLAPIGIIWMTLAAI